MALSTRSHYPKFLIVLSISLPFLLLFSSNRFSKNILETNPKRENFVEEKFPCGIAEDIPNQICSKIDDKAFCCKFLQKNSGSNTGELRVLTVAIINSAQDASYVNHRTMESLIPQTSDPVLKNIYTTCSDDFNNADDSLLNSADLFQSDKLSEASEAVQDAGNDAQHCESQFNSSSLVPSNLQLQVNEFQVICNITQICIQLN
ncbi:hypothetical protein M5689_002284 [Euphorbia peplus]|nr:hypothetical protein M5689_002284 [Euphorbia peplus]